MTPANPLMHETMEVSASVFLIIALEVGILFGFIVRWKAREFATLREAYADPVTKIAIASCALWLVVAAQQGWIWIALVSLNHRWLQMTAYIGQTYQMLHVFCVLAILFGLCKIRVIVEGKLGIVAWIIGLVVVVGFASTAWWF